MIDFKEIDLLEYEVNQGLHKEIKKAKDMLYIATKDKKNISLSFSGGKDSLASLLLLLEIDIKPVVVWFNSGYEFPETKEFIYNIVSKYDLNIREIEPTIDPLKAKIEVGFFDLDKIYKVNKKILKVWWQTNKEYELVITGIRVSESQPRKRTIGKNGIYFYNKSYSAYCCYPVAYFQNKEVFAYITSCNEDYHPIYYKASDIKDRESIRVNWYILSFAEPKYYVFLKRHYPEVFNFLASHVTEVKQYV